MWRLCGRCPTLVLYFLKHGEEQSTKLHEAALIKLIFRVTSWIVYLARKIFENRILLASAGKCGGLKDGFGNVPGGCGKRPRRALAVGSRALAGGGNCLNQSAEWCGPNHLKVQIFVCTRLRL